MNIKPILDQTDACQLPQCMTVRALNATKTVADQGTDLPGVVFFFIIGDFFCAASQEGVLKVKEKGR